MKKQLRAVARSALLLVWVSPLLFPVTVRADWQNLGTRWAIARDGDGRVSEIDDLTYPGILGRIVIGHLAPIKAGSLKRGALGAEEWWRSVPWKIRVEREPESFALDDIDWSRATNHPARFEALTQEWSRGIHPGFLKHFRFNRAPDGGYEILWDTDASQDHEGWPPGGRPLQVVTLRKLKSNLWRTLGHQVLEGLLTDVTGLISIPVVAALINTAVDRFFHWSDLLTVTRKDSLAELLAHPPDGFELSPAERERAAEGLLYAETDLITSPSWFWLRPRKQWATRMASESKATAMSRAWYAKVGVYTQSMSDNFDWEPPVGTFYLSGAGLPWGHPNASPAIGLDSARPNAIFARRVAIEATTIAVIFASGWIPYVGALEVDAFKALVETPEDLLRRWEARLGVRLEERESRLGENWEPELDHLAFQQENPFEVSRAQTHVLVDSRRKLLGLEHP